ncbi:MAG: hypothetical protein JNK30_12025 [Phenylobacterium sp.]|uniref:hypothetical protein n=1 Tax=Phenylobacterium sp. TaxID=1871053 RepID=UPI001A378328|nr:hypothetical protein [Phenylobacterium sp.]MBL8772100.1 hypothetical protein [Phenylobacterium sp.]
MSKVEFASREWLAALRSMLDRYTALAGPDTTLSICEVFTGVPPHLDAGGDGRIAWHCRIEGGKVTVFADGEIDDADIKTVADYHFILPFARMKLEPGTTDEYQRQQAEGARLGKVKHEGDRSKVPPAFYGMHNELAEMTA